MTCTNSTLAEAAARVIDGTATAADRLRLVADSRRVAATTGVTEAHVRRQTLLRGLCETTVRAPGDSQGGLRLVG